MRYRLSRLVVALVVAACAVSGCATNAQYMGAERLEHGLVVSLDGVGGYNWGPQWLRDGLNQAGVRSAIYIFDWGHGPAGMFLADLMDESGNREQARELARMVENYQRYYPGRPVYLIGHSGGAGIVVFALEAMKSTTQVDGVFLLAPALDPDRNLAPALAHVRQNVYVTHSPADVALMGLGTSTFGTMDRKHTVSAGLVGFRIPTNLSAADARQYAKLRQAEWKPDLLSKGNLGGHMSWTTSAFAREYIAPIVLGRPASPIFQAAVAPATASPTTRAANSGASVRGGGL